MNATLSYSWPGRKISLSRNALVDLMRCVDNLDGDNADVESYLSKLLVVRSCGHIELTLEQGILDSLEGRTDPHISSYIKSGFFKGRNPQPERIKSLLGSFHSDWEYKISELLDADDEYLHRELKFLVSRRNNIAHGQSESVGRRKALDLCQYALKISDEILRIVRPS